jgi:mRNA-degrading endonuclease RelE of RelBE toxin-antitoxin system
VSPRRRPYRIEYAQEAVSHLAAMDAGQAAIILDVVPRQLKYQPRIPTRNRKLLRANPVAPWELRIDDVRVYFDVSNDPEPIVTIRAIGIKRREKVFIGGEEVDLQ